MILRNGILSALRGKWRTALFAVLILLMCLSLTLGAGMWAYCSAQLRELDENYTTIALVEYMGPDYPDENAADDYARAALEALDAEAIAAVPGVKLWESRESSLAYLDGYNRLGESAYSANAIIEFTQFAPQKKFGHFSQSEEAMPETFAAMSTVNWEARIRTGDFDTGILPLYTKSNMKDYGLPGDLCIWTSDPISGEILIWEEWELPESYILLDNTIYRCVMDGEEKLVSPALFDFIYNIEWFHDSLTNTGYRMYSYMGEYTDGYTAIANDIIYARDVEGTKAMIIDFNGHDFTPEKGRRYTIHGQFTTSNSSHLRFSITDFYEGCPISPVQDTKETEADPLFYEYADYYARANNYVTVEASSDIASLEAFQQSIFRLSEGRLPAAGEQGVCTVSRDIVRVTGLGIGDQISLDYFASGHDDRFDMEPDGRSARLEIVGIADGPEDSYGYVWVSEAEGAFGGELYGYTLGRALLDNASARSAAEAIEALCGDGVRVSLFDQGYSGAAQPLETMKTTATAVTLASALGALAVIFLFAYLFVGRQRETVNVLFSLGTPGAKISLWLLSGAVIISGIASAIGAFAGGAALGTIIEAAFSAATELYAVDSRYSEAAVGVSKGAAAMGETPLWPAAAAFCFIFILSLLFCWVFLRIARKQTAPKKGKMSVRVPKGGTSLIGKGAMRFALLSARRGGWRSGVVPAAALVLSIFLGILANASAGWGEQMDALYRDAEITGRAVSTNGRRSTELTVSAENARTLWKSGMLEGIYVSKGFNYWLGEEIPAFGTSSFAQEARQAWIGKQPEVVALNGMDAAPEFIYSGVPEITWLSGWNESFLSDPEACASVLETIEHLGSRAVLPAEKEADTIPCLMPESLLERIGLGIGDSRIINFRAIIDGDVWEFGREMLIVGSFAQAGGDANIYVPLTLWCDEDWITGEEDLLPNGERVDLQFHTNQDRDKYFYFHSRFGSCAFTLSDAGKLDELRDYLHEKSFTRVDSLRSNRTTVLLFDRSFVETVGGLGRYISFSQLLFPVLFALVALLGFIVSWLMVNSRRMEFAILRGLGASKMRVFFSFFLEQTMLCLIGSIVGCIGLLAITGSLAWLGAVGIFALCYLLGAALSVMAVGRTHLMSLLSERE
ncbi:MAG: hypothetical protein IKV79_02190 [Oscillospiraceae bacterium]|nr:hypothetical protein [Oscillospiraceae bacterium]